ncbi:MAG: alpha/beta fold hydrolase [Vulcanimicrobiaceae bacterium]
MQVLVDEVKLAVHSRGTGESVILLHGFPLTHAIWDAQCAALATNFRVVTMDLRGSGGSGAPPGPYLVESLASDVAGVLDALGIECANLIGHSLGGYVALAFARMFTERVVRLALVCSRLAADTPAQAAARRQLATQLECEGSVEPVVDAYLSRLFAPARFDADRRLVDDVAGLIRSNSSRGLAALLHAMAQRPSSEDIAADLAMPALVLAGEDDLVVSIEESRAIAAAFPAGRVQVCSNSGHLPMLEAPQATSAALAAFLALPVGAK